MCYLLIYSVNTVPEKPKRYPTKYTAKCDQILSDNARCPLDTVSYNELPYHNQYHITKTDTGYIVHATIYLQECNIQKLYKHGDSGKYPSHSFRDFFTVKIFQIIRVLCTFPSNNLSSIGFVFNQEANHLQ